ncbi:MAG: hypothetical protein RBR67_14180 [Desulfobacterium sp.]|nr:hypothetical protein [Desulfobacterium sp.]
MNKTAYLICNPNLAADSWKPFYPENKKTMDFLTDSVCPWFRLLRYPSAPLKDPSMGRLDKKAAKKGDPEK